MRRPKWSTVGIALGLVAALAITSPAIGTNIKKLVKKEVAKQISKATGPSGPQGQQGIQGEPGLSGVHTLTEASGSNSSSSSQSHVTSCPTGEVAVGGGAFLVDETLGGVSLPPGVALVKDQPNFVSGGAPTGWWAGASELNSQADNWHVTVQAVCVKVAP